MSRGAFVRCAAFDGLVRCRRKVGHLGSHKGWATGTISREPPRTWEDTPRGVASAEIAALFVAEQGPWGRPKIGGPVWEVDRRERVLTPPAFADALLALAKSCVGWTPAPRVPRQQPLPGGAA